MLSELHGKDVVVHLGIFADAVSGRVLAIDDQWIQVKTKKQVEYVSLASVKRIIVVG